MHLGVPPAPTQHLLPIEFSNPRGWLMWAGITAVGGAIGAALVKPNRRKKAATIGAAVAGVPALVFLGFASGMGGNAMFQLRR